MPTSLLGNWESEFARFDPELTVVKLVGPGRDKQREAAERADILLTSYGTFCRDRAYHLARDYDLVIADEASLLRNPDSEISRTVAKLRPSKRLALTGTPVENRVEDLWSIFRFVAPGYLGGRKDFAERYQDGDRKARERLGLRISPYYLRRTKREVVRDLPEKIEIDEWLDLTDSARELYRNVAQAGLQKLEDMKSEGAARMHLLTILLRLRQICLDPALVDPAGNSELEGVKTERLVELLDERHEEGRKTLVFSQFRGFLHRLRDSGRLPADRVLLLDGSTRDRSGIVEQFQTHEGSAVFLISLKAGGYGLNLTAADTVIHMDPWWNPAAEAQASDRAHRIGQTQPVTIYRLLGRDTVEERVRRIQAGKQQLIDALQSGAESEIPAGWSDGDLRGLLGGA